MSNRPPTFKQQWVLSMTVTHLLYEGVLYTRTFSPFRGETDSTIKKFLNRMEKSGWLMRDTKLGFYLLTEKSLKWKKENSKMPSDYHNEFFKTHQS